MQQAFLLLEEVIVGHKKKSAPCSERPTLKN